MGKKTAALKWIMGKKSTALTDDHGDLERKRMGMQSEKDGNGKRTKALNDQGDTATLIFDPACSFSLSCLSSVIL